MPGGVQGENGMLENSLIIQAQIEALDPQQILARDQIVKAGFLGTQEATSLVQEMGGVQAGNLKELLQNVNTTKEDIERLLA
jgi:hypothetical protein